MGEAFGVRLVRFRSGTAVEARCVRDWSVALRTGTACIGNARFGSYGVFRWGRPVKERFGVAVTVM